MSSDLSKDIQNDVEIDTMSCENCQIKEGTLYLAPYSDDSHTWLCLRCLQKKNLYCAVHDNVHVTFSSGGVIGGHACLPCIENRVSESHKEAETIYGQIKAVLLDDESAELEEWLDSMVIIAGDQHKSISLIRAIMTYSAHKKISVPNVVADIISTRKIDHIILPGY